jgi:O-acetylhomoserine/O-acetylserine sulfhydrylase-like pyridoxal-dependent enzyme
MKKQRTPSLSLATRAIHGKHLHAFKGPVATPIYQTSTYRFENSKDAIRYAQGDPNVYVYTRYHNPTVNEVEDRIALMEGGETAALFSSGMAAISTAILSLCRHGDEIVSTPALYGGTYRFFRDTLPSYQIGVNYVDPNSLEDLMYLITPRTKVVYFETPTNPTLSLVDIGKIVRLTRRAEKEFRSRITIMIIRSPRSSIRTRSGTTSTSSWRARRSISEVTPISWAEWWSEDGRLSRK